MICIKGHNTAGIIHAPSPNAGCTSVPSSILVKSATFTHHPFWSEKCLTFTSNRHSYLIFKDFAKFLEITPGWRRSLKLEAGLLSKGYYFSPKCHPKVIWLPTSSLSPCFWAPRSCDQEQTCPSGVISNGNSIFLRGRDGRSKWLELLQCPEQRLRLQRKGPPLHTAPSTW